MQNLKTDLSQFRESLSASGAAATPTSTSTTGPAFDRFLSAAENERGCYITSSEGAITLVSEFNRVFTPKTQRMVNEKETRVADAATFKKHGFTLPPRTIAGICAGCKQISLPGCCSEYAKKANQQHFVVYGMIMTQRVR